jgi:hypothetical protein
MALSDNFSSIGLQLTSVKHIIEYIKDHSVKECYNEIITVRKTENFSLPDFLHKILQYLLENYITNPNINKCIIKLAQIEKNLLIGSLEKIHVCAIIATIQNLFI